MKCNFVAWIVTLSGFLFITLGHFIEPFGLVYLLCPFVGLITSIVLIDMR